MIRLPRPSAFGSIGIPASRRLELVRRVGRLGDDEIGARVRAHHNGLMPRRSMRLRRFADARVDEDLEVTIAHEEGEDFA